MRQTRCTHVIAKPYDRIGPDTRYVALQLIEIGGDHLDQLIGSDESASVDATQAGLEPEVQAAIMDPLSIHAAGAQ